MIIAYLRCSTDEQTESQNGINAQSDACIKWATNQGNTINEIHSDESISGATGIEKRPGLMTAINSLSANDILLVAKRDRLGRDPLVLAMIEATVNRAGARIVSAAGEGTENNDPSSILMRRMVDAFSEYERLIISARTKAALAAKKKRGERTGSIPYGYDLAKNRKNLIKNTKEQKVITEVKKLRESGMTLTGIARNLAERGFKARSGKMFHPTQIVRLAA